VIDECHMLSTSAFNALLKTLEEPPDHVVFVLATTDPQRVLPTIISRCQRFDFRRIPLEAMVGHLSNIATNETIDITADAIRLIAQIAQGGLRDAESLLDQLSLLSETVTVEKVWDLVGAVPERDLLALVQAIAADHATQILDRARNLMDRGREPLIVLQNLAGFYRDLLIAKTAPDRQDLVALTADTWTQLCDLARSLDITTILAGQQHLRTCELQVKNTAQPRLWLEVALMGLLPSAIVQSFGQQERGGAGEQGRWGGGMSVSIVPTTHSSQVALPTSHSQPPISHSATSTPHSAPPIPQHPTSTQTPTPPSATETPQPTIQTKKSTLPTTSYTASSNQNSTSSQTDLAEIWQQVMLVVRPFTSALLKDRGCLLAIQGNEVKIGISTEGLLKLAQKNHTNMEAGFKEVLGREVKVVCFVVPRKETPPEQSEPSAPEPLSNPYPSAPSSSNKVMEASPRIAPKLTSTASSPPPPESDPPQPSSQEPPPFAPTPIYNQDVEDVRRSAKNLAEWFGGIVVDLEQGSGDDRLEQPDTSQWADSGSDSDSEDVPF